ncbi:FHA domain-containing protein [Acaryochloris sp. IP29b_bin.137]|uniref:FHA domain-containing protein n=1 Tax=Acaryochloris sp. IP29b_bin.137 TaxID=2969217 RepID=UPI00262C0765|nr:FHA domain-containing protein [Acaryochloris sp. IP29b_bin.137]
MSELTLQWSEFGQTKTQVLRNQQPSKQPGKIRLGRDPALCDIVFQERSVSGLHVEIFFQPQAQQFFIRSLRLQNPPLVDGILLKQGDLPIRAGSRIKLGRVELQITAMTITPPAIPPTFPKSGPSSTAAYGLQCPQCHHVSAYSNDAIKQDCPMCGHSMATSNTVFIGKP